MSGHEIRKRYLAFMEERAHAVVPSSGIVPENDPTTLFTGSGMQPMLPFLLGETHPKGTRIVDSQKCFRAEDIDEVGDNRHTTFFEMLGNWSFGDYFREEQITWMFTFLVDELGLDPEKLYVTVFAGDAKNNLPKDEESVALWTKHFERVGVSSGNAHIGSEEDGYERGMREGERIFFYDAKKNWWSRAGAPTQMPAGEPGGPDTEMFYDFGTEHDLSYGAHCHPNCDCGRFMEIGNNVFMQYLKNEDSSFSELPNQNVDFGGGLERIAAAVNNEPDVFKIDLLWNTVTHLEELSGKKYESNVIAFRIIADHIRGAVFMIGDGIFPGNTEQGYFVRRLLRRSVRYADALGIPAGTFKETARGVIATFKDSYPNLVTRETEILDAIEIEELQFRKTLETGLRHLEKILTDPSRSITAEELFDLYQTHGFPLELTIEIIEQRGGMLADSVITEFRDLFEDHKKKSRAGAEEKFKGGLADNSVRVVEYHTITHLMLAGLRKELGEHVHQAGSNITGERLRFDFTHPEKVSREILDNVEAYVNTALKASLQVTTETVKKSAAEHDPDIEGSFWDRYPDEVKVYTIAGPDGEIYSKELCGGPHVESTASIEGVFKITKEESSSAGVRRIKGTLT